MARSTFLLQFQEPCDDMTSDPASGGGAGDPVFETITRSRETNDQHASDMAFLGASLASSTWDDPASGMGTMETKARETTDQNRADDALSFSTATATREADDADPSQRSYRTFSW